MTKESSLKICQAGIFIQKDYLQYIKEFVKLKPTHYHIGGQIIKEKKTHLALRDCDFDLKEVLKLIPKNAEITLEVTTDPEKTLDNINIMRRLMKELNIINGKKSLKDCLR